MKYTIFAIMLLVAGCAHVAPPSVASHHVTRTVAPVIQAAPIAVQKKTFKQRWLSKFFRDRAVK